MGLIVHPANIGCVIKAHVYSSDNIRYKLYPDLDRVHISGLTVFFALLVLKLIVTSMFCDDHAR